MSPPTDKHERELQRKSAERVRAHIASLTRAEFQDLTRRLVLYAARLLRAGSLDHHAYEIVTGAIDLALDGTRTWDPQACPFDNFLFGVVRSGAVKIMVNQRFPLRDAAAAHRALEARQTTGSTVLLPG